MAEFADEAVLRVTAGDGGHGCVSLHREKYRPLGGPDGGNGGRGGDVILEVDPSVTTLLDIHRRPLRRAANGRPGAGSNRAGADGPNLIVPVPDGTVVKTTDGVVLADLVGAGSRFVAARGGKGGLGNAALASPRRKLPRFALKGEPGERRDLLLELKTIADVGLVGFPNAGKSSLIAAMSAARPKVADYPFTTITPHLGVVEAGDVQFVMADVPGLIPGASRGRGLGLAFLRHVERCSVLVHVLDCAAIDPDRDPVRDLEAIEAELTAYREATGADLGDRTRLVAVNKIDVPAARQRAAEVADTLQSRGLRVVATSAATGEGLRELGYALAEEVATARRRQADGSTPPTPRPRPVLRPRPLPGPDFELVRTPDGRLLIRGDKPRRWVQQTDFGNDEAVAYLTQRLTRLGVEDALADAGVEPGAEILIGDLDDAVVFDWEPTVPASAARHGRARSRRSRPHGSSPHGAPEAR